MFRQDPELAEDWLLARRAEDARSGFREEEAFAEAVAALDRETRQKLLENLDPDYGPPWFFATLVGTDPDLFAVLLKRPELRQVHLDPLAGSPHAAWVKLAKLALDAGYTPTDLVRATHGLGWSWTGHLSNMWDGWAEAFRPLEEDEDERIREIGRIGREDAEASAASARERERQEEAYGFD